MVLSNHLPSLRVGRGEGVCKEGLGESGGGGKGEGEGVGERYRQAVEVSDHLLVKHGFLLVMGIDKDVWIWKMTEQEDMENDSSPDLTIQFRLKGNYSTVLCCDMDKQGHIMTGSQDALVRLWKLGPDLRDRSQHDNPVSAVRILSQPAGVQCGSTIIHQGQLLEPSGSLSMSMTFTWTPRTSSPSTRWSTSSSCSSQILIILFRMGL
jgi:WD40 repeat protein